MAIIWPAIAAAIVVVLSIARVEVESKTIWSHSPASSGRIIRDAFPIGNGRLGAMPFGQPGQEKLSMNIDSLWSGGPFESSTYNGGNPSTFRFQYLQGIRDNIFRSGTGNITQLLGTNNHYGTFRVLGNVSITLEGINSYNFYNRSLDLTTGIHQTSFMGNDMNTYTTLSYCSFPAKVCIYRISSSGKLPNVAVSVENRLTQPHLYKLSCGSSQVRLTGVTQDGETKGMEYDMLVRLSTGPLGMPLSSCSSNKNGTIVVTGSAYGKNMPLSSFSIIIGAATDYDMSKGNANDKYAFRGNPPGPALEKSTAQMSTRLESKLMIAHTQDYQKLMNEFHLELFDPWAKSKYPSESLEFYQLLDRYKYSASVSGIKKRDAEDEAEVKKKADFGAHRQEKRVAQFAPRPSDSDTTSTWKPAATPDADSDFPKFPFPTILPSGYTPTAAIPWSTAGTVTATGHDGQTHTLILTATPAAKTNYLAHQPVDFSKTDNVQPDVKLEKRAEQETILAEETLGPEQDPTPSQGDPYVESLLFDYARHLFISSSREDSLPPNLQGLWEDKIESAWSGDYHANINLQMNHWFADQVGLGALQAPLWNLIEKTWMPRGTETARLLYNGIGWVTHDEMNIFGHTGLKNSASWGNYPMAGAWMMQHVFDHWDYTRDLAWLQKQGYNMVREAAQFWTTQLVQDRYSMDNTLVVNPCNSPEKGATTFGCANWQQLLVQLFTQTLILAEAVNDIDPGFKTTLNAFLLSIDDGIHLTSWGGLKEFKLPENFGLERQGDKTRHMAHLVGWFPGYSIAAFNNGYYNETIQKAVAASLRSRGNGQADGNTGWGKIWRAGCWARLNDTEQADFHLRFAISQNIGSNGLNVYDGKEGPFQIDANFGIAGAMLSMLIADLPMGYPRNEKRSVVLGPAIPSRWGPGKVKGLRIRGGTILEMSWNNKGVVDKVSVLHKGEGCKFYSKEGKMIGEI